jgi:hypothetical protein
MAGFLAWLQAELSGYRKNFEPNWISRGSPGLPEAKPANGWTLLKICPKLGEARSFSGKSKFGRLVRLSISNRNSTLSDDLTRPEPAAGELLVRLKVIGSLGVQDWRRSIRGN